VIRNFTYPLFLIGICSLVFFACDSNEGYSEFGNFKYKLAEAANLIDGLDECSGFINIADELICINDGGNSGAVLYYFNPLTGQQTINSYSSIMNKDWEAIAQSEDEIIIFDTGNNKGQRPGLDIHHIDILTKEISYSNTFMLPGMPAADPKSHNLDIEAAIIKDNKYCLFTKNRADNNTDLFIADLGENNMTKVNSIGVPAMVTDAHYHDKSGSVLLLCNQKIDDLHISYISIWNISDDYILTHRGNLPLQLNDKVEAITAKNNNVFYIGSEKVSGGLGKLYEIKIKGL